MMVRVRVPSGWWGNTEAWVVPILTFARYMAKQLRGAKDANLMA